MMNKLSFFIFSFLFSFIAQGQTINVADYGAKANSFEDVAEQVRKAVEACKAQSAKTLVFPKGRYDFYPEKAEKRKLYISNTSSEVECPDKTKNIGLLFEDMSGLTIEGNGSTFVFHGKMISWSFINCANMTLNNVIIDYERPTMSELTLLDVQSDHIIAQVHPDSKYALIDDKVVWYGEGWNIGNRKHTISSDTVNGINQYSSFASLDGAKVSRLDAYNKLRFEGKFDSSLKKGSILSIRNPIRDHVGAFVWQSKNINLNNVTMHYMHGLGITSQFSENLCYKNVKIVPSNGRSIAAFADGMQFSGCKGYVKVDSCHFKGLHDDPINVHGTYLQIVKQLSADELVVEFKHHQTYGFQAFFEGDTVAFVSQEAIQTKGQSVVKNAVQISERQMKIALTKPIPKNIEIGDCLENLTWTPELEVRNSRFERTNTRGLLVTTPRKVLIENNIFYRTGMHAVLIAGDVNSWFESGAVADVTIKNNLFVDCAYGQPNNNYQIAVEPENREIVKNHWVHRNIKILDNRFEVYSPQILRARSVNGLVFRNNTVVPSNPASGIKNVLKFYHSPAFRIDNCTKVDIRDNQVEFDDVLVRYADMKKSDIKSNFTLEIKK